MTTATLTPNPKFQGFDLNGDPLSGGKLYSYETGTSTPLATYPTKADAEAGTNANANPVILDSRGEANVWLVGTQLYRLTLTTSADVAVWGPIEGVGNLANATNLTFLQSGSGAVARTVQSKERDIVSAFDFGSTATQATIETALTSIGTSAPTTLLIPAGTWVISSNADLSTYTNVVFQFAAGAILSHGSYTINIPNVDAGIYQVFSGTGTVTISGAVNEVFPEWFGVDGTADDVQINQAIDSITKGQVTLSKKTYNTADTIHMKRYVSLIGQGERALGTGAPYAGTQISYSGAAKAIDTEAGQSYLNGALKRFAVINAGTGTHGLYSALGMSYCGLEDLYFYNFTSGIVVLTDAAYLYAKSVTTQGGTNGQSYTRANAASFTNCRIDAISGTGFEILGGRNVEILALAAECGTANYALKLESIKGGHVSFYYEGIAAETTANVCYARSCIGLNITPYIDGSLGTQTYGVYATESKVNLIGGEITGCITQVASAQATPPSFQSVDVRIFNTKLDYSKVTGVGTHRIGTFEIIKRTLTTSDFSTTSTTATVLFQALPTGAVVIDAGLELVKEFDGTGGYTDITIQVGDYNTTNPNGYIPATSVKAAAGVGYKATAYGDKGDLLYNATEKSTRFWASGYAPYVTITCSGGTTQTDDLTAGEINVWIVYQTLFQ